MSMVDMPMNKQDLTQTRVISGLVAKCMLKRIDKKKVGMK